jgi:signal transduction histidine kinase/integral membrane sensor domain MASE1
VTASSSPQASIATVVPRSTIDVRRLGMYALVGVVYVVAAKVGFRAAFVADQVSPVWPATGIALWAAVYFGPRVWPAVWLGAAIANVGTELPIVPACVIAVGNTLEALTGAWLLRRFAGVDRTIERLRDVVMLVVGCAIGSTTISATIGVMTLCAFGLQSWSSFGSLWWTWWLGDATGALLVAPLLLTIPFWRRMHLGRHAIADLVALEAIAIAVSVLVFALWPADGGGHHRLEYLVFPLVMWGALRFAHPGAALVSLTVSCIAIWGTLEGAGPFSDAAASPHERITMLQIFTSVIATSALVFGAAVADRHRAEQLRTTDHMLTAVLSQDEDLETIASKILEAVADNLDWDVGLLWQVDDGNASLEYVDGWERNNDRTSAFLEESRRRRFLPGVGLPGRVWATGAPAWIFDVAVDSNFPRAPFAAECGLHGGFAFPILAGSRVLGVMEFFTHEFRRLDASQLALMTAAGSQIGQYIERRRAQYRLAKSETLASELLERERAARVESEQANRAKDLFLATVSHELRTPLTAILGWASMLQRGEFDAERAPQIYERIFRNAQAQAQIVNDLLDVSRIVSGQLRLEWQRLDLFEVVRSSVDTMRPTAAAKGIAIECDIPSGECLVSGDAARLQQVMWNLLSNAIKFTNAGGSVAIAIRTAEDTATVEVSDTGIGIAPQFLPRLFERFWQADDTSTRVYGGLGLGLALARHIVEIHGGDVKASSPGEGRGSRFVVRLPIPDANSP